MKDQTVIDDARKYWRYTFAGMAMQGMIARDGWRDPDREDMPYPSGGIVVAEEAVKYADALLKELEARDESTSLHEL